MLLLLSPYVLRLAVDICAGKLIERYQGGIRLVLLPFSAPSFRRRCRRLLHRVLGWLVYDLQTSQSLTAVLTTARIDPNWYCPPPPHRPCANVVSVELG
jgi:hypothetical protein